ncbi:MAG TPA: hypothetical protein VIK55_06425, partial [Paludibacter sp.]
MSRTKGSGWGGGVLLYQKCPICQKKKALYDPLPQNISFKCTSCKARFYDESLICRTHPEP